MFSSVFISLIPFFWASALGQAGPPERPRPFFDRVFEPVLGDLGTVKGLEEQVNIIGGRINAGIDFIHDTDHGVRICNQEDKNNNGVCFTSGKCGALNGKSVGSCFAPTPKTTCCKFDRVCGEASAETVTYFASPERPVQKCEFMVNSRLGACQIRVDFLEFSLPSPDPRTGLCTEENGYLEVTVPYEDFGVGKKSYRFCGSNSGQHFYVHIGELHERVQFRLHNPNLNELKWNIKVTQVDCRSGLPEMREIRAPDGCLQYFYERFGALGSFNVDLENPIAPDQDYAICFNSNASYCALALQTGLFELPQSAQCSEAYFNLNAAIDENDVPISDWRFCGPKVPPIIATQRKPFHSFLKVGPNAQTAGSRGILMVYELLTDC